jgi:hypothetical protein
MSSYSPPKALFHYTSIEALSLILQSKKIRFSKADLVNDLEELRIIDVPELKKSVFISCWTASAEESVPLWKIYASNLKGVRIKLPTAMFERGSKPYLSYRGKCSIINLMSLENVVERGKGYLSWIPFLFGAPVQYSSDNSVSVLENEELIVDRIGNVKLKHWEFEEEFRFVIIPDALWNQELKRFEPNKELFPKSIKQKQIDIPLSTSAINNIEVTLGPAATDAEYGIVDALLSKFTSSHSKIADSKLKNKIRFE